MDPIGGHRMKVVILAGGLGSRLAEETTIVPKPMVTIGDRPIIWHIMKSYSMHGYSDFIVCLGYKGYVLKEYFSNYALHQANVRVNLDDGRIEYLQRKSEPWTVTLVDTGAESMTGGRLGRVRHLVDGTFLATYGDGVSDVDISELVRFHQAHGSSATMTAVTPPGRYGALEMVGSKVTAFREKPPGDGALINGGFVVLEPDVLDLVEDDSTILEEDVLPLLASEGRLHAYGHSGFWHPMDTLRDRRYLESLVAEGKAPWVTWLED